MKSSIVWSGCSVSARDDLRNFLQQRRELGEPDVVLSGLTPADALSLATAPLPGADWRSALRAADGAPPAARPASVAPSIPRSAAPAPPPSEPSPSNVVIGGALSTPDSSWESLEAIASVVAGCTLCALHKTARNPVPGEGNPNADMMFVGEAPGETEDQTGRPFIGKAGQLLTKIIEAISLRREDVFICNVLKHRPPGNRNPLPDEVAVCSPYLRRQIELVKPKVIVALGTFAAQTLLNTKSPIGKLRGQVHQYHGVPLVVTYHPAALLRNPAWKRPTWEDVQLAHRVLQSASGDAQGA
jgi:uracil-DNA glycosylase family 4